MLCLRIGQENYHFPAISCSIQERFLKKWKKKLKGNLSEKNLRSKQCENKFHKICLLSGPKFGNDWRSVLIVYLINTFFRFSFILIEVFVKVYT